MRHACPVAWRISGGGLTRAQHTSGLTQQREARAASNFLVPWPPFVESWPPIVVADGWIRVLRLGLQHSCPVTQLSNPERHLSPRSLSVGKLAPGRLFLLRRAESAREARAGAIELCS